VDDFCLTNCNAGIISTICPALSRFEGTTDNDSLLVVGGEDATEEKNYCSSSNNFE
jgi:hypothetical protein